MCVTSRIVKRGNNKTKPTNQKQPHVSVFYPNVGISCVSERLCDLTNGASRFAKFANFPFPSAQLNSIY